MGSACHRCFVPNPSRIFTINACRNEWSQQSSLSLAVSTLEKNHRHHRKKKFIKIHLYQYPIFPVLVLHSHPDAHYSSQLRQNYTSHHLNFTFKHRYVEYVCWNDCMCELMLKIAKEKRRKWGKDRNATKNHFKSKLAIFGIVG